MEMNNARKAQTKMVAFALLLSTLVVFSGAIAEGTAVKFNDWASKGTVARYQNLVDTDVEKAVLTYTNISNGAGTGVVTTYQFNLTSEVTADDDTPMEKGAAAYTGAPTTVVQTGGVNFEAANATLLATMDWNKSSYLTVYYRNATVDTLMEDAIEQVQWAFEVVSKATKADDNDTRDDKHFQHRVTMGFVKSGVVLFSSKLMHADGSSGYEFKTGDYTVNQSIPLKTLLAAGAKNPTDQLYVRIDGYQAAAGSADSLTLVVGLNTADAKGRMSFNAAIMWSMGLVALGTWTLGFGANPRVSAATMFGAAKKARKGGRGGDL